MTMDVQEFDELYAISDLHMGGETPARQIFDDGKELGKFIDWVRERTKDRVALVVNGDFVDFLAEPGPKAFDPEGAAERLKRIANDSSFLPVWQALGRFVKAAKRTLVITLGNHDLELALPWVREVLLDLLASDDPRARGCIHLALDGAGFRAKVGAAQVLAVHGNEADDWNVTDHETIRRIGRDLLHGRPAEAWIPNAGTQLVIAAMNDIKRAHPFVDLLKPELQAVIPVLIAVAPDKAAKIKDAWPTLARLVRDKAKLSLGLLGEEELEKDHRPITLRPPIDASAAMDRVEEQFKADTNPMELLPDVARGEKLGWSSAAWNYFVAKDPRKALREALEGLQRDRSFDTTEEDETFRAYDQLAGPEIDFVLTGHTHLARNLKRRRGKGHYLNSGTWARLIRLDPAELADPARFNRLYAVLGAQSMAELDAVKGLVIRRRTVIKIHQPATEAQAELLTWTGDGLAADDGS